MTQGGIRAIEELEKLEEERREGDDEAGFCEKQDRGSSRRKKGKVRAVPKGIASNEMCKFLIMNISSLQLIPVNMIAYRSQYGSVNPAGIVGPAIVATLISTLVAIIFCKIMDCNKGI